jgi:hypothetical protein
MENNYLFVKNFAWCLVPFHKIMDQSPKMGSKHPQYTCMFLEIYISRRSTVCVLIPLPRINKHHMYVFEQKRRTYA